MGWAAMLTGSHHDQNGAAFAIGAMAEATLQPCPDFKTNPRSSLAFGYLALIKFSIDS
jgi:hypothetical protein